MSKKEQSYQPTPEELEQAEEMLTEPQKDLSRRREFHRHQLDATWYEKNLAEDDGIRGWHQLIEGAEKRGERIIEISFPLTVKIPVGAMLRSPYRSDSFIETTGHFLGKELFPCIIRAINEQNPEVVEAALGYQGRAAEVVSMTYYGDQKTYRSSTYDLERAKKLIEEMREIEQRVANSTQRTGYFEELIMPVIESAEEKK